MTETISIVGLGKLGACMAGASASRGFRVIGVDISPAVVDKVNRGEAPVQEPGLNELYRANAERLSATADYADAVAGSDITFVYVNTPSLPSGAFSSKHVVRAAESIGAALRTKDAYHLVVLVSTVIPGVTQTVFREALERASGKTCPDGFGLCFNPEFIALGTTVRNMLHPDFVVIGEVHERCGAILEDFYRRFCENDAPIVRTSLAEAELVKVGINSYLTMKITFANLMSQLCERIPQTNADRVTSTIGLDSRIGRKFLKGGLPYGGPCFPRDNGALGFLVNALGLDSGILTATDAFNDELTALISGRLARLIPPGSVVGVLGLAYKPGTDVVTESPPLHLVDALAAGGFRIVAYDPLAMPNAMRLLPADAVLAESARDLVQQCNAVVLAGPCDEFLALESADFPARESPVVVIDCWRMLQEKLGDAPNVRYYAVGIGDGDGAEANGLRLANVAAGTLEQAARAA